MFSNAGLGVNGPLCIYLKLYIFLIHALPGNRTHGVVSFTLFSLSYSKTFFSALYLAPIALCFTLRLRAGDSLRYRWLGTVRSVPWESASQLDRCLLAGPVAFP